MNVSRLLVAGLALSFITLTGCSSQKSDSSAKQANSTQSTGEAKTPAPAASMGIVNSKCPIVPDHIANPNVLVDFQGQKVALCCKGCTPAWNKLSDAEKATKIAAAK